MTLEQMRQVELLARVNVGIADMTLSRDRVQAQLAALEQHQAKLERQIVNARRFGRQDLAQRVQTLLNSGQAEIAELKSQLDQVLSERAKLATVAQRLQAKIDGPGGPTAQ